MCQFLESICCINGEAQNLVLHQKRVNCTFQNHFKTEPFSLETSLTDVPKTGKYKCRIIYNEQIQTIEFIPYQTPQLGSLKVIEANQIDYFYKFLERGRLDDLFNKREQADDIIISKNGLVTDACFANLVFFDGDNWYTPSTPLLKGTRREFLLNSNQLIEKEISISDIKEYQKVSLINAMLDLSEVEIDVCNIYR